MQEQHVFEPDNLFGGTVTPKATETITVAINQSLKRGTVLGRITSSGEFQKVDSTKSDGSEIAIAILAEDVETTDTTKIAVAYLTGEFNKRAVTVDDETKFDTHEFNLRKVGIFLEETVSA